MKGYSPDGDSIRFHADKKSHWKEIEIIRRKVDLNKRDHAQLRIEGADTLETHYKGKHQPKFLADTATDFLLEHLCIDNVKWGPTHYRVTEADDNVPGYILTRSTDIYGRPVSFVFAGTTPKKDGNSYFLDRKWLRQSLNYKSLLHGHAYPTFYTSLFWDLRDELTKAVKFARPSKGIWPHDKSKSIKIKNMNTITEEHPIFPKLFRRLIEYMKQDGKISEFGNYLQNNDDKNDKLLVLKTAHTTHLDNILNISGNTIKMQYIPEEIAFISKD